MSSAESAALELLRAALRTEEGRRLVAEIAREEAGAAPAEEWLTVARAAELAGYKPDTVRRWIQRGDLPATGRGRGLRIRRRDLDEFLESRRGDRTESDDAWVRRVSRRL